MASDQFGSPKEKDDIARVEQGVSAALEKAAAHFEMVVDKVAPREIGSVKMSSAERLQDNVLNLIDVEDPIAAGEEWIKQRANQVGLLKALDEYADEIGFVVKEVEKARGGPL